MPSPAILLSLYREYLEPSTRTDQADPLMAWESIRDKWFHRVVAEVGRNGGSLSERELFPLVLREYRQNYGDGARVPDSAFLGVLHQPDLDELDPTLAAQFTDGTDGSIVCDGEHDPPAPRWATCTGYTRYRNGHRFLGPSFLQELEDGRTEAMIAAGIWDRPGKPSSVFQKWNSGELGEQAVIRALSTPRVEERAPERGVAFGGDR
jgi:hypothetical protein